MLMLMLMLSAYLVARGFIPDRLRSSRNPSEHSLTEKPHLPDLGLLRNPSGINPLTTVDGLPVRSDGQ
jgi:hypothetical protein